VELFNEFWRRVCLVLDRSPRQEAQIASLRASVKSLGDTLSYERQKVADYQQRIDHLDIVQSDMQRDTEQYRQRALELEASLRDEKQRYTSLESEFGQAATNNAECQNHIDELHQQVTELEENKRMLSQKLQNMDARIVEYAELWHVEFLRAEGLQKDLEAIANNCEAQPEPSTSKRSQSLGPCHENNVKKPRRSRRYTKASNSSNRGLEVRIHAPEEHTPQVPATFDVDEDNKIVIDAGIIG
jgi:chromosome segregation ATPase